MDGTVTLRRLDPALLPAFLPYLLPEAARAVAEGMEGVAALGAVTADRKTCGAVAGALEGDTLTVFSLFVDPAARRQGVASLLLEGLWDACPAKRREARWALPRPEFDALAAFLAARGFDAAPGEDCAWRFSTGELRRSPSLRRAFSPAFRPDGNVLPLAALTGEERRDLEGDPAIDPRLRLGGLRDRLTPELSFFYRYGGRAAAYFVCGQTGPREAAVLAAVSRSGTGPAAFLHLAAAAIHAGLARFGGDFTCWADAVNGQTVQLLQRLSGGSCQLWRAGRARWTGGARPG